MSQTRVRVLVVSAVLLLAACASDGSAPPPGGSVDANRDDCQGVVDGDTYTRVVSAKSTNGALVKAWFGARTEGGTHSSSHHQGLRDDAPLIVCLLEAPGIAIPQPPGSDKGQNGRLLATVILGLNEQPVLDAVGPADRVEPLYAKLAEDSAS